MHVDTRESILVQALALHTPFIACYRFPLQCHAPSHTAAATVANTVSLHLSVSFSSSHTSPHSGPVLFIPHGFSGTCCDAHFPFSSGGAPSLRGLGMWDKCIRPPRLQLLICFETSKVPTKHQHIPPIDQQRLASSRGMVEFT